jgi:hypothetical protein
VNCSEAQKRARQGKGVRAAGGMPAPNPYPALHGTVHLQIFRKILINIAPEIPGWLWKCTRTLCQILGLKPRIGREHRAQNTTTTYEYIRYDRTITEGQVRLDRLVRLPTDNFSLFLRQQTDKR